MRVVALRPEPDMPIRTAAVVRATAVLAPIRRRGRWLVARIGAPAPEPAAGVRAFGVVHRGVRFDVVRLDQGVTANLGFYWRRSDGRAYASLTALRRDLALQGERLVFAVNGGIFSRARAPLGLFVQDGQVRSPLNTATGIGNFFVVPNGVFAVVNGTATVLPTCEYPPPGQVGNAVQSGPMLVIDGMVNPCFIPDSGYRLVRNAVGVDQAGRAVFVISSDPTNFHDLATLFRDRLDCRNALFLDGQLSRAYLPTRQHPARWSVRRLVTIIGLTQPL